MTSSPVIDCPGCTPPLWQLGSAPNNLQSAKSNRNMKVIVEQIHFVLWTLVARVTRSQLKTEHENVCMGHSTDAKIPLHTNKHTCVQIISPKI